MKQSKILDSYILTFKDNAEPIVVTNSEGKTVPAKWLVDLFREVQIVTVEKGLLEVAVPFGEFLRVFETQRRELEMRSEKLIRLRTSPFSILGRLSYPIAHIDNQIK